MQGRRTRLSHKLESPHLTTMNRQTRRPLLLDIQGITAQHVAREA
jgi:hypothetical protein